MATGFGFGEGKRVSDLGDVEWMDATTLRHSGFLQEANRQFFHPHGLALAVLADDERPEGWLGIIGYREEGIHFERTDEPDDYKREAAVARHRMRGVQPMGEDRRGG